MTEEKESHWNSISVLILGGVILLCTLLFSNSLNSINDELNNIKSTVNDTNYLMNKIYPIYADYLVDNRTIPIENISTEHFSNITLEHCTNSVIQISPPLCSYCVMQEGVLTDLSIPYSKACAEMRSDDYTRCVNDSTFLPWNISYYIVKDFGKALEPYPIVVPTLLINCTQYRAGTIAMYNLTQEANDLTHLKNGN